MAQPVVTKLNPSPSTPSLEAQLAVLKAENEALKSRMAKASRLSLKVSEKGALSVYGLGRFPVTLYREQWERLLALAPEITAFIGTHEALLAVKSDKPTVASAK